MPAAARARAARWAPEHAALRPVARESMHVTLAFLGEVADPDEIVAALAGCAGPAGGLSFARGRWLAPRRPHVLVLEVADPAGGLRALQVRVARALGHDERRPFLPHVTVARVRGRLRPWDLPPAPPGRFAATHLTLYRSHLGRGPARYEALWREKLTR